ncbi:putative recombinase A [Bacillus phage BCP78]|uniref:Putative recombinase A n=2 Tax=Tsarbombavirus BCP78 TaxID=1985182 RepID=J9PRD2_9CAUD|nr:UvsX-like recombinase [Bacillus phage BCP78]YP_009783518.1 putative recombinase A [Bacillus phage BCU4]AEW47162.1 putative recombinase A [Bacillus phage BCP78]AEW47651.1 putative recombinase A [Bacillus phage BCU4]
MAKAKGKGKNKANASLDIDLSSLADDAGLVILQDSDYALVKDRLPLFLPKIDRILGGGLPFGRMVEIYGKPSGGKSVTTHHAARVAAALGCIVVLIDVEGTADRERLAAIGVDISKVLVKQPDEEKGIDLTVEEIGETIETTLKVFKAKYPGVPVVYIWDSVGQTPSKVELEKDFGEQNVGARAKAITQFVTKVAPQISESKSLLIGINQVRDNIGGNQMFPTVNVPGGKAWEHYASLRLEIKKKGAIEKTIKGKKEKLGHLMGVKTQKSKVSRPFQEEDCFLISDNGIDYEYNLAKMAEEAKILPKVGQSYEYIDQFNVTHKKSIDNFIDWLREPEGQPVRQELLNRLILEEFPEGYPALKNETLDISGWIDQIMPLPVPMATNLEKQPSMESALDAVANEIVNGEGN